MPRTAAQAAVSSYPIIVALCASLTPEEIYGLAQVCHSTYDITGEDSFWEDWGKEQSPAALRRYEKDLVDAAEIGDPALVYWLTIAGVDPAAKKNRALFWACADGHVEVVHLLVSLKNPTGTPLVDPTVEGDRELGSACKYGHIEVVQCLFSLKSPDGTPVFDPTAVGNRAFSMACAGGSIEVIQMLLSLKSPDGTLAIDPAGHDNDAIREACYYGQTEVVRLLLSLKNPDGTPVVDPAASNSNAIYRACSWDNIELVRLLLEDGRADPAVGLAAARKEGSAEVIELLEAHITAQAEAQGETT